MCEYDAKQCLVAAMLEAFLGTTDGGPKRAKTTPMSRLELKCGAAVDAGALEQTAKRVVDDVYAVLRTTPAAAAAAAAAARKAANEEDGGGEDDDEAAEEETSTLGRLTQALNAAFLDRWPLHGDAVIQIGATFGFHGAPGGVGAGGACCSKHILVLGTCEPIDGVDVRCFKGEADMLLAFVELVRSVDPDVLLGYNIFGFDMAYMHDRAKELMGPSGCAARFCRFGRVAGLPSKYVEQKLSSSALGDNVLKYLDMHGRVVVDLMKVVQRDHRLDSYKLDSVAEHFLGMHKHDVSPNDVFR
jgi:hypothetical protein